MKSQYLDAFKAAHQLYQEKFHLIGDNLLVESLPAEENKSAGGIILATGGAKKIDGLEMNLPVFVRVLAKGEGYYNEETGDAVGLEVEVGDIILVGRMSVAWFSVFGSLISTSASQIGRVRECEIAMLFKGDKAYDEYFAFLNEESRKSKHNQHHHSHTPL